MVRPRAMPRGIIVTLWTGSAPGVIAATSACPASWYAVFFFSSSDKIKDLRSTPINTLSLAISKSAINMNLQSRCAARDDREIHVVGNRLFAGVHAKDFFAALHVRPRDNDTAVEAARPQQ